MLGEAITSLQWPTDITWKRATPPPLPWGRGWTEGQVLSDYRLEGSDSKPQQSYLIHSDLRMSKHGRITTVLEMVAEWTFQEMRRDC